MLLLCAAVSLAACQFDATWSTATPALDDDYDEIRRGYVADYGIEQSVLGNGHHRKRDDPRDPFYERIGSYRRNRAIDSRYFGRGEQPFFPIRQPHFRVNERSK